MLRKLTIFCLFIFAISSVLAQAPCASDEILNQLIDDQLLDPMAESAFAASVNYWRTQNPGNHGISKSFPSLTGGGTCTKVNYIIPVVVHVVHDPANGTGQLENIDSLQIINQLEVLNASFNNVLKGTINKTTGIQFALATKMPDGSSFSGIIRHASTRFHKVYLHKDSFQLIKKEYNLDDRRYLNIYVVNEVLNPIGLPTAVGGYASYPHTMGAVAQGIVVEYDKFGSATYGSPIVAGSTGVLLTHEVGHYLGLYHPFRDSCNGSTFPDCETRGDLCCDIAQSSVTQANSCTPFNSCSDSSDLDAINNYMYYSPDNCKNEFSPNQLSIMLSTLQINRSQLSRIVHVNELAPIGCYWTARFDGSNIVCKGDDMWFEAYDLGPTVLYTWEYGKVGAPTFTQSGNGLYHIDIAQLDTGNYTAKLTIAQGSSSRVYTYPYEVRVEDCKPIQSTKANWLFGDHAGLHFYENKVIRSIGPQKWKPNIQSFEGSTGVSKKDGSLLFYAGGTVSTVRDTLKELAVFGKNYINLIDDKIEGSTSSSQSGIVVPFHTDSNKFHLFTRFQFVSLTSTTSYHFNHNLVDLSFYNNSPDEQFGKVTTKNKQIADTLGNKIGKGEGISAIKRCDDSTYWLVTAGYHSVLQGDYAEFYVVSDTGVAFSHRVPVYIDISTLKSDFIKFSPDGNWVWIVNSMYRFCREDGSLTLEYNDSLQSSERQHGVCFSPDSRLFYKRGTLPTSNSVNPIYKEYLYQYDLLSAQVKKSKRAVKELGILPLYTSNFKTMQIGPDGKIYISAYNQPYVAVVNSPNSRVTHNNNECDLSTFGVTLTIGGDGGVSQAGLPNFIDASGPTDEAFDFTVKHLSCYNKEFVPHTCCASQYTWDFGDGSSSNSRTPSHTYDSIGEYTVTLIIGLDTISKNVTIGMENKIEISGSSVLCDVSTPLEYTTHQNINYAYDWSAVGGILSDFGDRAIISWADSGLVKVVVQDEKTGCIDSAEKIVRWRDSLDVDFEFSSENCSDFQFNTGYFCDPNYSWNFGDGTTSTLQNPIHAYASSGPYTVSLSTGGETKSKTVNVGIGESDLVISGDTLNCDAVAPFAYSVPYNSAFMYLWSSEGTSAFSYIEDSASAVWAETGSVKVVVVDNETNCSDSATLHVNKDLPDLAFTYTVTNCTEVQFSTDDYCGLQKTWLFGDDSTNNANLANPSHTYSARGVYAVTLIVDGDSLEKTVVLDNVSIPTIAGPVAFCDTGTYDFMLENYEETDSFLWSLSVGSIKTQDSAHKASLSLSQNTVVTVDIVSLIGCEDQIAIAVNKKLPISDNTIFTPNIHCRLDSNTIIVGSEPQGGTDSFTYQWYSYNSTSGGTHSYSKFISIDSATSQNFPVKDTMYGGRSFVRKVISEGCESWSNQEYIDFILPAQTIWANKLPCFIGDTIELEVNKMTLGVGYRRYSLWYSSEDSLTWSLFDSSFDIGGSNQALLTKSYFTTAITTLPGKKAYYKRNLKIKIVDTYACNDTSNVIKIAPTITVTTQPKDVLLCNPANDVLTFDIEISNTSISTDTIRAEYRAHGASSYTDLGLVSGNTFTYTSNKSSSYSHTDTFRFKIASSCGTFYSRKALITVDIPGDVWMRDSEKDIGLEPNPYNNHYDIVKSPDIWNRVNQDNSRVHENPEYKKYSSNYLYYVVRNRSSADTSLATNLYLYWSFAAFNGEIWDTAWTDNPYNRSKYSNNPMGGQITSVPVEVPPIAPGDSFVGSYPWSPPSPGSYFFDDGNGGLVVKDKINVCLLARLEHCEMYPHKMTYNEKFGEHVKINAINNNNIVTKNLWVVDEDENNVPGGWDTLWIPPVRAGIPDLPGKTPEEFDICFDTIHIHFFDHFKVLFTVGDELREAILAILPNNPNILYLGGNRFKLLNGSDKCIKGINMSTTGDHFVSIELVPKVNTAYLPEEEFLFGVSQYNGEDSSSAGACVFSVDNRSGWLSTPALDLLNQSQTSHIILSPNPTPSQTNVELDQQAKDLHVGILGKIIVADGYGYVHLELENIQSQVVTNLNLTGYKAGVYNIRYEIGGNVYYKYLVKTDE